MTWLIFVGGFPRNKNYFKRRSFKIVLIILLIYVIVSYLLGLILGFNKPFYQYDILANLKNILIISLFIICMETSRYLILSHNPSKKHIIILTLEFIILSISLKLHGFRFDSFEELFIILSTIIIPLIANEMLLTYLSYSVGLLPSLLYRLSISLFIFIVPFVPSLGNYLTAIFGLMVPFAIYIQVRKSLLYKEKYSIYAKKHLKIIISLFLTVFLLIIILLVSGLFRYQLVAIVSDSMVPVYNRGDAVIYEKMDAKDIKIHDILVYKYKGSVVTHRVVEIEESNGKYIFKTKGDNNDACDTIKPTNNEVLGKVKFVVKFIGYPTIWFSEQLKRVR